MTHIQPRLEEIPMLRKQGMTEKQVAKRFGVAYSTFQTYIKLNPELKEALKTGKEELILELEDTLYNMAMGNITKPTHIEEHKELDKRTGKMIVVKRIEKTAKTPNMTALIFALKNLDMDRWQDRRNIDANVSASPEHLEAIASTLRELGSKGIDLTQFDDDDDDG